MESKTQLYNKVKPFLAVILLQFGYAGLSIICKFALNKGMSQHVLVVYRSAIATVVIAPFAIVLDRSPSPRYCFFFFFFLLKISSLLLFTLFKLFSSVLYVERDEKANHFKLILLTGRGGQS